MGVLFGDVEGLPRSATAKLKTNAFGYDFDLIEIGVRGTGIERLIRFLFGPTGYLRLGTRSMKASGLPEPKAVRKKRIVENFFLIPLFIFSVPSNKSRCTPPAT